MNKSSNSKKILFVAQDLGGYKAILPVFKKMKGVYSAELWLAGVSRDYAEGEFGDVDGMEKTDLTSMLEVFSPDIAVVGTSLGKSIDKTIIELMNGLPTVAIVDFWAHYKERFDTPVSAICVVDDSMERDMVDLGFDESVITVTGNPLFDSWVPFEQIAEGGLIFIEQPFSELDVYGNMANLDEVTVLSDVLHVVGERETPPSVLVCLHPRTKNLNKFDHLKDTYPLLKIQKGVGDADLADASLVVGMSSMVLFEAAIRGKRVLSYQPSLTPESDPLPSNRSGLSKVIYDRSGLKDALENLMDAEEKNERVTEYLNGNATQRVIGVIEKFL